jgi:hypothetical protein
MTGPEHYREAERLLHAANPTGEDYVTEDAVPAVLAAQVHATLALAAFEAAQAAKALGANAELFDPGKA